MPYVEPQPVVLVDLNGNPYKAGSSTLGFRAAAVGDSITATTNDVTNNQLTDSWFTYLILASGGRLQYSGNYAQGGTDSATILAHLTSILGNEYLTRPFDVLFINAGVNDTLDGNNRPTATAANIRAMVALCQGRGIRPVLGTLVPAGMTTGLGTPTAAPKGVADLSGGGLTAGTYYYAYTRYNDIGETPLSPASTGITLSSTGQINLTLPADKGARYNIYRATSASGPWGKVQSLGYITTNSWLPQQFWTDGGSTPNGAPPSSDGTAQTVSTAIRRKLETISRWVRRYAAVNGIDCIDFGSLSDGFGAWKSGYTIDGTHPAPHASRIMGQAAWSQLQFRFPAVAPQLVTDSGDPENLISNGCFTDNDGTGAGGWGGYGGTTPTRVTGPKTGFVGAAYQVTRTDSSPWYDGGPWATTGFTAGDRLACGFVLQTEGVEASNALIGAGITFQGGTTPNAVGTLSIGTDIGPVAIWFDTVVPAGVTAISPVFNVANAGNVGSAAPTAKASIGQMTVFNLTTGLLVTP